MTRRRFVSSSAPRGGGADPHQDFMNGLIPVLLYNSVGDDPPPGQRRHTVSRARFRAHLDAISAAGRAGICITELAAEVGDSRAAFEALTEWPVLSFAYPHGAYDWRARDAVIAAGYRSAVAVKNAASHLGDDPFAIARW